MLLLSALVWCSMAATNDAHWEIVVLIHTQESEGKAAELLQAISIHASDLPLRIEMRLVLPMSKEPATETDLLGEARLACGHERCLAVISWSALPDGRTLLHIADTMGGRVLTREISAEESDARFETMALISRSTLAVMLDGGQIGVAPPSSEPTAQTPEPPDTTTMPSLQHRFAFGAGYALAARSSAVPVMHGMDLLAGLHLSRRFLLRAGYTLFAPADIRGNNAEIRLRRHPVSLGGELHLGRHDFRWHPGVGLAFFVDRVLQETRSLAESTAAPRDNEDTLFGLSACLFLRYRLSHHFSLTLRLEIEYYINNVMYIYNNLSYYDSADKETHARSFEELESPWRIQPGAHLGLLISLP